MIYTTHGAMTPADLAEHRADTDWYELHTPADAEREQWEEERYASGEYGPLDVHDPEEY